MPFVFDAPEAFGATQVSRALMGTTFAYLAPGSPLRLTITVMPAAEIHARVGRLSAVQCINLFLEQLQQAHAQFFVAAQTRPLAVDRSEFPQFRWSGKRDGRMLTGVLACGQIDNAYYAVDFVDALDSATDSFPDIRAALRRLAVSEGR